MTADAANTRPRPNWLVRLVMVLFRTLLLTILFTGLGMAAGLLTGILWNVISAMIHHTQPDMTNAYRNVAIPVAIFTGGCALLWNIVQAVRRKR
jgi:hypothetical protein